MNKELKSQDIIPFIRSKDYKFIQNLGSGSFGRTVLIKDEIIDSFYACKKYEPNPDIIDEKEKEKYFDKFIDEIKILNKIVHPNIVRIYNSYIYPGKKTGYIIMEYVENAKDLNEYITNNKEKINYVFEQIIDGFCYMEKMQLCHRDIRSKNILIDSNGIVKIIDFGFGKTYSTDENIGALTLYKNSWIAPPPSEMNTRDDNEPIYNNKTEIYFVGHLIKQIIEENNIKDFKYYDILTNMIKYDANSRTDSFAQIRKKMYETEIQAKELFTKAEKTIYKNIVQKLDQVIETVEFGTTVNDFNIIIDNLEKLSIKYSLEDKILNNRDFAQCFFGTVIKVNEPSYFLNPITTEYEEINTISTDIITKWIDWLKKCDDRQQKIIIQNLQGRLEHYRAEFSDLPF